MDPPSPASDGGDGGHAGRLVGRTSIYRAPHIPCHFSSAAVSAIAAEAQPLRALSLGGRRVRVPALEHNERVRNELEKREQPM